PSSYSSKSVAFNPLTICPVFRLSACTSITTRSVLNLMLSGRIISCRDGFWAEQNGTRAVMSGKSRHSDLNLDLNMFQPRLNQPRGELTSFVRTALRAETNKINIRTSESPKL